MANSGKRTIRIGGASGFWGDSAIATPQLLKVEGLNYLVFDYLAETTMAILARAMVKNPALGYAVDFVTDVMERHLATALKKGVKIIANAGGLNPKACRDAIARVAEQANLCPKIVVVHGDDLLLAWNEGRLRTIRRLNSDAAIPNSLLSMNAYVGARGVAEALAAGADIVITGRTVDSATVLGAAAYEFGWSWRDWDRLAGATIAGHLIECGAQATGGLFTDWERVGDWDDIGYPVIDVADDGSCVLFKPVGTGGLIDPLAVSEQLLYEVGDPTRYVMPDVVCDLSHVHVEWQDGRVGEAVKVSGMRGLPPTPDYKGNATWQDGFQIQLMMAIRGIDAPAKAGRTADALLKRTRRMMADAGFGDYSATNVEVLGCESQYGPHARALRTREVVLRIAARHQQAKALRFLQKECSSAGTSMAAGTRSTFSGRVDVQSLIRVLPFVVDKREVPLVLSRPDSGDRVLPSPEQGNTPAASGVVTLAETSDLSSSDLIEVPLVRIAVARSGDKGDDENIGVIARHADWLPYLRRQLTAEAVRQYLSHLVVGGVERYEVPGLHALNFVLHGALGGGGVSSLRSDPLGKSFAQMLLDFRVRVPAGALEATHGKPNQQTLELRTERST
jgi:hypothetical protein